MTDLYHQMKNTVLAGFMDKDKYILEDEYAPKLLFNSSDDYVKTHIDEELSTCQSFTFAVAFVTEGMLTDLKVKFADLALKGIRGRIITSTYLSFNHPKVFRELLKIPNVEVKILDQKSSFHAKGYIFNKDEYQSIIIGSSNLTEQAMLKNYEWNIRLTSYQNADLTEQIITEVEKQWTSASYLTKDWIDRYELLYKEIQYRDTIEMSDSIAETAVTYEVIKPNKMQLDALNSLKEIRLNGKNKALIVSATGTGKTYLGAFDVKAYNPDRFLFIVHSETILKKAMKSFRKVLGGSKEQYGLFSGNIKDKNARFLFATIQTISKEERLNSFDPEEFDYILVDEAHKSGANSYRRVIEYFKPDFLLGMTATPERTDDFNIYELFDYNLAFEIRLQDALEEDMLCPFHYIGVTDYEWKDNIETDNNILQRLVSQERMDYVEEQINYYGYSGESVHGLIFCSMKDEAYEIAQIMTDKGYRTVALTGEDSIERRERIIAEFEAGEIDYIVTVDIFNEGIDIPCVNQVVMLRNTQSSIVFVQQLGRGLRKFEGKEYVTVIDFIGNYKNNYLIPTALTGDNSRSKDSLRGSLRTSQIMGISTINFSEIAKERIYESINQSTLDSLVQLREDYQDLKDRLGRVPGLSDFSLMGSVDSLVLLNKFENHFKFLTKMGEKYHVKSSENAILSFVSQELVNGYRIHEPLLIQMLLTNEGELEKTTFIQTLEEQNIRHDDATLKSMLEVLSLEFYTAAVSKKYNDQAIVVEKNEKYILNGGIYRSYQESADFSWFVDDALNTGIQKASEYNQFEMLTIGKKYTRKDACRLLNWESDESSTMYGYKNKYGTCPLFITYNKKQDNKETVAMYEDEFLNSGIMHMFTRHPRKLDSPEVVKIVEGNRLGEVIMPLFVKKSDDEGSQYYYLGMVNVDQQSVKQEKMLVKEELKDVVTMNLILENPVKYSLYLDFVK